MSGESGTEKEAAPIMAAATKVTWHCALQTAPRPGNPTIGVTLSSLASAGWPIDSIRIFDDTELTGCWQAWMRMLAGVVDVVDRSPPLPSPPAGQPPQPSWILLAEDDCQFSAGLRRHLESPRVALHPAAVHSLYCAAELPFELEFGWRRVTAPRQCWGSQAYLFSVEVARKLLASLPTHPMRDSRDGTDRAVGMFCRNASIPYLVHSPSFVRHIGVEFSSLDQAGQSGGRECNRQCASWIKRIKIDAETGQVDFEIVSGNAAAACGE